jgi:hypothetical protein
MNKFILALLAAMGRTLGNEATEAEIIAALQAAEPHARALAARPEATALANEQSARTSVETELATTKTKLAELTTALANERKAHVTVLIDAAVREGRITEAHKPVWASRLQRDFATESTALANERGALKTTGTTAGLGARKENLEPAAQFTALVNEAMPAHGNDRDRAWSAVKASAEGKALLELMEKKNTA